MFLPADLVAAERVVKPVDDAEQPVGKPARVVAFETVEQQLGFFDSLPMQSQLTMLDESIEGFAMMEEMFGQMVTEWVEGDSDGLATILNDAMTDPVLYDTLLTQRNANWAGWIDDRLDQPGTVFIAVGAGHLAGENSVQDFLEGRGLTAVRVEY